MVEVRDNVTLTQPEPFWGAVKGKTSYSAWAAFTVLYAALIVVTFIVPREEFFFRPDEAFSWFGIMIAVSALVTVLWLKFTTSTFMRAQIQFFNDAYKGREKWASTVFRDYLNQRYGTVITESEACNLVANGTSVIARQNEGWTENVRVYLAGFDNVINSLYWSEYEVGEIMDMSLLNPRLIIIEEPKAPKTYEFYQN